MIFYQYYNSRTGNSIARYLGWNKTGNLKLERIDAV